MSTEYPSVEKISEYEYKINNHTMLLAQNAVILITVKGALDRETVIRLSDIMQRFIPYLENTGQFNVLIDLNHAGKPSIEARETLKKLNDHPKIGKVAHFGMNPVAKVLANFVMGISKNKNMRFFHSRESAEEWLNNNAGKTENI